MEIKFLTYWSSSIKDINISPRLTILKRTLCHHWKGFHPKMPIIPHLVMDLQRMDSDEDLSIRISTYTIKAFSFSSKIPRHKPPLWLQPAGRIELALYVTTVHWRDQTLFSYQGWAWTAWSPCLSASHQNTSPKGHPEVKISRILEDHLKAVCTTVRSYSFI